MVLKVIYPVFKIRSRYEMPNTFEKRRIDLFGSEKRQLKNPVSNRNWLIVTVLQATACISGNSKQLQRHDSVHLSSVYADYSFSIFNFKHFCFL